MKREIKYNKLDGRGKNEEFKDCVLTALKEIAEGEGLWVIKEFEPFPLYELMEKRGFDKWVEKVSDMEYHVWFFPKEDVESIEMNKHLSLDNARIKKMLDIKLKVFRKELSPEDAKALVNETFEKVTPEEFAFGEQHMLSYGITDDIMVEGMDDIIDVFRDVMVSNELNLPKGHPIQTYADEATALELLVLQIENQLKRKFIKNEWLELYEKLNEINTHFSRKQNQLFSALERKGFDRPSTVMWTFDNKVRDAIKEAYLLLSEDKDNEFLTAQANVIHLVRDILEKERDILYPTSLKLLSDDEFAEMRKSDDEIGYCLIDVPPAFTTANQNEGDKKTENNDLLSDLAGVLAKHGLGAMTQKNQVLDVSMGKLTLEQINLIFKHLQIDLSYVDENEIVKFYSDTQHRVFPRSAGVIGRKVQNCHPRESVDTVEAIIEAFRKGEQDKAEFWLEMGDKFIYIIYNAVRDEDGNFRGVLEMMQDATHIRSLTGSQKLLTWDNGKESSSEPNMEDTVVRNEEFGVNKNTIIAPLLKKYPFLKAFLIDLNPKFKQLNNPVVFNTMGNIATLEMIAKRGELDVDELIAKIVGEIKKQQ
ncbi:DUF1858 domain-containing protein [Prolixibacteraceae bacterium JC049]|nr:DUF1858 domain-containing protein [Prolixibacteraceae bacterium JC049]